MQDTANGPRILRAEGHLAMLACGEALAGSLSGAELILLQGDLGMGKTTLCQGILKGLGYQGRVRSPTYTLVEPYDVSLGPLYHFDFYRIGDPQELDFIGLDEMLATPAVKLVEWPEMAGDRLPPADICLKIRLDPELGEAARQIEVQRAQHG